MLIFLTFETVTLTVTFLIISKFLKKFFMWSFPLKGCLYCVPFNKMDDEKLPASAQAQSKKSSKDKKDGASSQDKLIDYRTGAVEATYENMQKHEGIHDYDFIFVLLLTSIVAVFTKIAGNLIRGTLLDANSSGFMKEFFEDQNIDIYLMLFVVFCSCAVCWRNIFGMQSLQNSRYHSLFMALATVLVSMFLSLGYRSLFVGNLGDSINAFNIGVFALMDGFFKSSKMQSKAGNFLTFNGFTFSVAGVACLIVFLTGPATIKCVETFQVYRKCIRQYEDTLNKTSTKKENPENHDSLKRLHAGYKFGSSLQIATMVLQSVVIALFVQSVGTWLFGANQKMYQFVLAGAVILSLIVEAYSTHLDLKYRSQYLFELLVYYKPKDETHKSLYIRRCYSLYQEAVKQMIHAMSKSVIPFLLALLMLVLTYKSFALKDQKAAMNQTELVTRLNRDYLTVLRQQYSSPLTTSKTIIGIIPGYAVESGAEALSIYGEQPFTYNSGMNISYYVVDCILNYTRLLILNIWTAKYVYQIGYILMIISTSEDIE